MIFKILIFFDAVFDKWEENPPKLPVTVRGTHRELFKGDPMQMRSRSRQTRNIEKWKSYQNLQNLRQKIYFFISNFCFTRFGSPATYRREIWKRDCHWARSAARVSANEYDSISWQRAVEEDIWEMIISKTITTMQTSIKSFCLIGCLAEMKSR